MNGVSLLLILATIGTTPIWRQDESQRTLEYCLQIEPALRERMAEGYPITSELQQAETGIHRFCLRISSTRLETNTITPDLPEMESAQFLQPRPGNEAPGLILRGRNRTTDVVGISHGWEPNASGEMIYKIQLSPELLASLQPEDELYTPIRPEAGPIHRFELSVGKKMLVRRTANTGIAGGLPTSTGFTGGYTPGSTKSGYGTSGNNYAGPIVDTNNWTASNSGSSNWNRGNGSMIPYAPSENAPVGYNGDMNTGYDSYGNVLGGFSNRSYLEPTPRLGSGTRVPNNSYGSTQPSYGTTTGSNYPPQDYNRPANDNFASQPAYAGNGYGSGSRPNFVNNEVNKPSNGFNSGSGGFSANNSASTRPTGFGDNSLSDQRFASNTNQPRAGIGGGNLSNQPLNRTGTGADTGNAPYIKQDSWQNFLMLMVCALFLSIGGNLYLGWTAAEFYSRYRTAIDRMRGGR
ncbi:MAG: hypothetical protein ACO1RA_17390 [Planctomycetaceae bacterium]